MATRPNLDKIDRKVGLAECGNDFSDTLEYPLRDAQKPGDSHRKTDTLLLVPLAQMRSGTYVDFREGPPTLVNLVVVGD